MAAQQQPGASHGLSGEVAAFFERYGIGGNAPWMAVVLFVRDLLPRLGLFSTHDTAEVQGLILAALEKRDFSDQALSNLTGELSRRFRNRACELTVDIESKLEAERQFSASLLAALQALIPELREAAAKRETGLAGIGKDAGAAIESGLDKTALAARIKDIVGAAIVTAREESALLEKKVRALEHRSRIDPLLTTLRNRRAFDEYLPERIKRQLETGGPMSLYMIDIDHFKAFNDTYGHQTGDDVLKAVAKTVSDAAKKLGGFAARYGGEELCVIVHDLAPNAAFVAAEALRADIAAYDFLVRSGDAGSKHVNFTVSIGVADLAQSRQTAADLIGAADKALYLAKNAGRNRVVRFKD